MGSEPLISVITVCFNSAPTLARALQSVADQDWVKVEHIVIDGASVDETREIVEGFPHVAQFVSEPDKGIYDAMNKGLDRANGDIVCFLNADDHYASHAVFSHVIAQMREHKLDALMGDVGFFHEVNPSRLVRRYSSGRFTPDRLAWGWMPAHPALFLSRAVVERVGRFKIDYHIAGDFEFIVRAFYGQSLRYLHLPEVLVRMQSGGVSTSGAKATMQMNREMLRACRSNRIYSNWVRLLSRYPLKVLEFLWPSQ
ncbi:glycosyltransferase family 2 protein [Rhodoferax saidenbachensis]|uniref:Glycosyltransferase involved in cell wall biosynthesis n=1 Tax=Rhodoferax saidenbachensis TaxID=1484693 RepID=A0ABU1ZKM4_9BURK|nr:glycosyltransferase family 2 protein [Rhodoferax saidenbachensis]MDR7306023.1 glycosyltransferase involved in cell wall biosynthesis [Rhodoferax saidenbachensis]